MVGYICKNCGFRTETKRDTCPYCNWRGIEKEKTAEELLEGVGE